MLAGDTPVPRCPGGSPGGGRDLGTPKASLALVLSRPDADFLSCSSPSWAFRPTARDRQG